MEAIVRSDDRWRAPERTTELLKAYWAVPER
jgi:hypothetical protein